MYHGKKRDTNMIQAFITVYTTPFMRLLLVGEDVRAATNRGAHAKRPNTLNISGPTDFTRVISLRILRVSNQAGTV